MRKDAVSQPVLPFSAGGAVRALEFGTFGTFAAAVVSGLAALGGAPAFAVAAGVALVALGSTAAGYAIGRGSRSRG